MSHPIKKLRGFALHPSLNKKIINLPAHFAHPWSTAIKYPNEFSFEILLAVHLLLYKFTCFLRYAGFLWLRYCQWCKPVIFLRQSRRQKVNCFYQPSRQYWVSMAILSRYLLQLIVLQSLPNKEDCPLSIVCLVPSSQFTRNASCSSTYIYHCPFNRKPKSCNTQT